LVADGLGVVERAGRAEEEEREGRGGFVQLGLAHFSLSPPADSSARDPAQDPSLYHIPTFRLL